jgi:hypothetical protein
MKLSLNDFHHDGLIHLVGSNYALQNQLPLLLFLNVGFHDILLEPLRLFCIAGLFLGLANEGFDPRYLPAESPLFNGILHMPHNHLEAKIEILLAKFVAFDPKLF